MQVIVAATMSNDPEIHRDGCADVKRGRRNGKYQSAHRITVDKVEDAAAWFWEDFLPGGCAYGESGPGTEMTMDDAIGYTRFLPCTKGL